jgi:hypothetical protein
MTACLLFLPVLHSAHTAHLCQLQTRFYVASTSLQVQCTFTNAGNAMTATYTVTTAAGGVGVITLPPGGAASGAPGTVNVFCTAMSFDQVCKVPRALTTGASACLTDDHTAKHTCKLRLQNRRRWASLQSENKQDYRPIIDPQGASVCVCQDAFVSALYVHMMLLLRSVLSSVGSISSSAPSCARQARICVGMHDAMMQAQSLAYGIHHISFTRPC